MTDEEFVAEINSKCPNLTAGLNENGLVIKCKDSNAAACIYYNPILFRNIYGIVRYKDGRGKYLSKEGKRQLIDRLKKAIGYKE